MAAATVPTIARVSAKWARRAASAGTEYEEGVKSTTKSWAASTKAAEANYKNAVTQAAASGRYGKGVDRAGDAKWKKGAIEKGPARYSQGVGIAEPDYAAQMAPVLEVIGRTDLPMRGPSGSDGNYQRSVTLGKALRAYKVGR